MALLLVNELGARFCFHPSVLFPPPFQNRCLEPVLAPFFQGFVGKVWFSAVRHHQKSGFLFFVKSWGIG